ncbi:hypothetical protein L208DRAFT_1404471 [Tricholoma matsutake]|nr:hypothetical protein L208DRAFT_1404471 [Tricholoma matsutake 945]
MQPGVYIASSTVRHEQLFGGWTWHQLSALAPNLVMGVSDAVDAVRCHSSVRA